MLLPRSGSSPLSRGIPCSRSQRPRRTGIIPALAGNTCCSRAGRPERSDHPRSRGEYVAADWALVRRVGSSPLSRGIRLGPRSVTAGVRIIPALAGNTMLRDESSRVRSGSSPLSRGILQEPGSHLRNIRIIPALAGNTRPATPVSACTPDHPRSRGEYGDAAKSMMGAMGSSPLSRGIPRADHPILGPHRIIPALAGNTYSSDRRCCRSWDHPRSRGEYASTTNSTTTRDGSSPLSRGIPRPHPRTRRGPGIIPALAGNTSSTCRSARA